MTDNSPPFAAGTPPIIQASIAVRDYLRSRFPKIDVDTNEKLVDLLNRIAKDHAPQVFAANLTFEPNYEVLLTNLSFTARPWAALFVASARPEKPRTEVMRIADKIWREASLEFSEVNDRLGRGFSHYVAGKWEIQRGNLIRAAYNYAQSNEWLEPSESPIEEMNTAYVALAGFQRGDIAGARQLAHVALDKARAAIAEAETANSESPVLARRAEGFARLLLAIFALCQGEFAVAESELAFAERAFKQVNDPHHLCEKPLLWTARGALHAFRAEIPEAEACFDQALRLAKGNALSERYDAITRAVRAELTAASAPTRCLKDARRADEFWPPGEGGTWKAWAVRACGVAMRVAGDMPRSVSTLHDAINTSPNELETARTRLELGNTYLAIWRQPHAHAELADARANAAKVLLMARSAFEAAGARYWLAQTCLALAEADPKGAAQWKAEARAAAYGDLAYARLLSSVDNQQLRIRLHAEPSVAIGEGTEGIRRFATTHAELLIHVLALVGESGILRTDLIDRIWPSADPDRGPQRLRTALWQARVTLGQEAWRLKRDGERIWLVLGDADVDDTKAMAHVERVLASADMIFVGEKSVGDPQAAIEVRQRKLDDEVALVKNSLDLLESQLLPPWKDLDWVHREHETRQRLVFRARRRLGQIEKTLAVQQPV